MSDRIAELEKELEALKKDPYLEDVINALTEFNALYTAGVYSISDQRRLDSAADNAYYAIRDYIRKEKENGSIQNRTECVPRKRVYRKVRKKGNILEDGVSRGCVAEPHRNEK